MAYAAEKYARALVDIGQEKKTLGRMDDGFGVFLGALSKSESLKMFFTGPNYPKDRKKHILKELFKKKVESDFFGFLELLVDRRKEALIEDINEEFKKICDRISGKEKVRVYSAVPLSDAQIDAVKKKFSTLTGKKIEIIVSVDNSLIGGAVFKIGDSVIDASILSKINRIRKGTEIC